MKKPFFARFLENQLGAEDQKKVKGGITRPDLDGYVTLKYPSDDDEDGELM